MLSECLSPHVDACQIERGPGFIDWVITQVAIEGLDEFRWVWVILEGRVDWILEQLSVCACQCVSLSSSVFVSLCACKDKYSYCKSIECAFGLRSIFFPFSQHFR